MSAEALGWVFRHSPLTGAAFQVHLALADTANDEHGFELWFKQSTVAQKARVTRQTVNNALARMAELGLVEKVGSRPGGVVVFRFLMPDLPTQYGSSRGVTRADTPATEVSREPTPGVTRADTGCHESRHGGVVRADTDTKRDTKPEPKPNPTREVRAVFELWQEVTGHPRAVLDQKRRRVIERALKQHGYDTCSDAICGWQHSPFHRGDNDRGEVYDDVTLILRDAKNIEKFARLWHQGPPTPPSKPNRRTQQASYMLAEAEKFLAGDSPKELTSGVA